jgi:endonuclease-3 related protein
MDKIENLYLALFKKYGKPQGQWSLWCKRPKTLKEKELIIIESILTQRANWKNVQMAIENLRKENLLSLESMLKSPTEKITPLIRSSGFYTQKAQRLKTVAEFFINKCKGLKMAEKISLDILRKDLLALNGIGDETADDILLYALEKPVFVIDEYTRRFVLKNKLLDTKAYKPLQKLFEDSLKKDYALYQDYHALIVIDGKNQ